MRRGAVVAATTLALLTGAQATAWAAGPDTPTDVQVSWADAATGLMRVTWSDAGAANKVRIEYKDGGSPSDWVSQSSNVLNTRWTVRGGTIARIAVVTTNGDGDSAPAVSPWFDTDGPGAPKLTAAAPQTDGSLRLTWTNTPAPADTTPNDPLDLPAGAVGWVGPKIWTPYDGPKMEIFKHPLGTTTAVIPARSRPYPAWVLAMNEWTSSASARIDFSTMKIAITTVPAFGVFGRPITIAGTAGADTCLWPDDVPCALWQGGGIPITMQTRAAAFKPWEYAGRYTAYTFGFQAQPVAVGGREYRFYAPAWQYTSGDWVVTTQVISSPKYVPTLANFAVAGFNVASAQVGQMVKLTVDVRPGGTVKGALQRWDGKYWRSVLAVPVTKGKAVMYVRAAGRGTKTYYRVAVPGMSYYGLPIETTGSRSFTLTVR
ncbi:hypothetical protein [Kribbella sp. NBC_00359]|uniref:hypothetical protein n=1 Tax=Kribbella sp. NBC_00359 TaxID=2975966 RepID=UPI002E20D035